MYSLCPAPGPTILVKIACLNVKHVMSVTIVTSVVHVAQPVLEHKEILSL